MEIINITTAMTQNKNGKGEETATKQPKIYTYEDLIKFSGTEVYSAFGEMRESKKPSAPLYSFGTSGRDAEAKKYTTKEMADIDCYGNSTPQGPKYNVTDKFSYSSVPKWKFGSASRDAGDSQPKYEHYFRPDVDFDPLEADKNRRNNAGNTRIGGEPRFTGTQKNYKITPGPHYNPGIKPEAPSPPSFSIYQRRAVKGFDPLIQLNSTPPIVGPGSYHPEHSGNTSEMKNKPSWSLPKGPRLASNRKKWDLNQTYDTTSSVGTQSNSLKRSMPYFSNSKAKRDNVSGIFKEHMQNRPMPVRIEHPKW